MDRDRKIDIWWKAFSDNAQKISDRFSNRSNFDIPAFMQKNLQSIDRNLMWEFGPAINVKGHRLVITPEYRRDLRPLVNEILKRAPSLNEWEFYPYRLPENFESAQEAVESRTGAKLIDLYFTGKRNDVNLLDLFFITLSSRDNKEIDLAKHQAFVIVESILGEEILDKWIGTIKISDHLPDDESPKSVDQLASWVNKKIEEIKETLSDKPFLERTKGT